MSDILYIVVPCYNEEAVLPETSKRLGEKMKSLMAAGKVSEKSKVLFVNDGSRDKTWEIISSLHTADPLFSGVDLTRNRGHQNALLAGLMTAKEKGYFEEEGITLNLTSFDNGPNIIAAMENGADKIRINPGNIGSRERIQAVVDKCRERDIPIRVGVNSGSLEKDLILITRLSYSIRSIQATLSNALSTSPSAVTPPYFSIKAFSRDPLFTPTRIGTPYSRAFFTTARTRSSLPMLPGLIRILSAPHSMAAIASR